MPGTHAEPPSPLVKAESSESANKIQLKLHHSTSFPDRSSWISELRDFDIVKYIKVIATVLTNIHFNSFNTKD